jgi:CspA family cold shock protein
MVFRDQKLVCDQCGRTFFFTVTEQRRLAQELGEENIEAPLLCSTCRHPVQAPEAAAHPEPHEYEERLESKAQVAEPSGAVAVASTDNAEPAGRATPAGSTASRGSVATFEEIDDFPLEEEGIELKLIGEVKWFNHKKGYGFLTKADGQEVFFHRSDVVGRELALIKDGSQVEFQIRRTDKGLEAFNVSVLPVA